jgi:hypothetical protein
MSLKAPLPPTKPRADDRPLYDIILSFIGLPAVFVAHELKLFPLLDEKPRSLAEICEAMGIASRPAEALLTTCVSLGLAGLAGGAYSLTPVSQAYLLPSSPTYAGGYLDMMIANQSVYSIANLKRALLTDSPQAYGGGDIFKSHEEQAARARAFTRAMHGTSIAPAMAWPEAIDLSGYRRMLDVGGGSGAHAIGAALRWGHLESVIFDIAPVCEVAEEFIAEYGLAKRIKTEVGDMWADPFPPADLHFYSRIYHDWPPEKCRVLTRKSFESLPPGGAVIIHEMLYNDEKTGPFPAAAYSIAMLLWTEGRQYSGRELTEMLAEAGFADLKSLPTFGYMSVTMGRKPR